MSSKITPGKDKNQQNEHVMSKMVHEKDKNKQNGAKRNKIPY